MSAETIPEQGSPRDPENVENPRRIPALVPNTLAGGIEYGIRVLKQNRVANIEAERGATNDETTQFFLIPGERPEDMEQAHWLARLFKEPRPPQEVKIDLDEHVNAHATDNQHMKRLYQSFTRSS